MDIISIIYINVDLNDKMQYNIKKEDIFRKCIKINNN